MSDGLSQAEGATGTTTMKIDETLKPKELLATSMTLEEADEWFRSYKAFLKHNERALTKLDVQVHRALLNKSIEAKLSSALRALPVVQARNLRFRSSHEILILHVEKHYPS